MYRQLNSEANPKKNNKNKRLKMISVQVNLRNLHSLIAKHFQLETSRVVAGKKFKSEIAF